MRTAISPRLATSTLVISGTAHRNPSRRADSRSRGPCAQDWRSLLPARAAFVGIRQRRRAVVRYGARSLVSAAQGSRPVPQRGDRDPELGEQLAHEWQAQADDRVVVALDPRDEGTAEAVDREGPRDRERLARRDVRVDLGVAEVREVHA